MQFAIFIHLNIFSWIPGKTRNPSYIGKFLHLVVYISIYNYTHEIARFTTPYVYIIVYKLFITTYIEVIQICRNFFPGLSFVCCEKIKEIFLNELMSVIMTKRERCILFTFAVSLSARNGRFATSRNLKINNSGDIKKYIRSARRAALYRKTRAKFFHSLSAKQINCKSSLHM